MARTGRPPKPVEQKRLMGNPGGRPLPSPGQLAVVPDLIPTMADQTPLAAFDNVMLMGVPWFKSTDAPSLSLLRDLLEERGELKLAVDAGHGDRRHLRDLDKQVMALLSQLGFDPTSR